MPFRENSANNRRIGGRFVMVCAQRVPQDLIYNNLRNLINAECVNSGRRIAEYN